MDGKDIDREDKTVEILSVPDRREQKRNAGAPATIVDKESVVS